MKKEYYKPKWKLYKEMAIPSEAIKNNANLRKFIRIRKTVLLINIGATAAFMALVYGRLL